MVLVSLGTLLAVSGTLVNVFKEEYIKEHPKKSCLDSNLFVVEDLFEELKINSFTPELFSNDLSKYGYELCVVADDEIIYSNLSHEKEEIEIAISDMELESDQVCVYSWDQITVVGEEFKKDDTTYKIVSVHSLGEKKLFGEIRGDFETFIIRYLIVSVVTIIVMLIGSQLLTQKIISHIMKPIKQLMDAASRIKEGDLTQDVVYDDTDEFQTVCVSFNQMQHHLYEEKKKNETYEKARTDMISGISHDLRTPLTSVKGYIKGIKDGIASTEEKKNQYLDIAYAKACEMDVLLQRLFYFSKIETGNMPLFKKKVSLKKVIEGFVLENSEELQNRGVTMQLSVLGDEHDVMLDTDQFVRVLSNFVENSLKYAGSENLKLSIFLKREGKNEILSFEDNGNGVEAEALPRIFEQFYRVDESRSKKNSEGNGLGLYIAKYIVEAHGGTIQAQNHNGLQMIITLPVEGMEV